MRPAILYPLFSDITTLSGIGEKYAKLLGNLDIKKIGDVLWHLPYSLVNRNIIPSLKKPTTIAGRL